MFAEDTKVLVPEKTECMEELNNQTKQKTKKKEIIPDRVSEWGLG